MKEDQGPRPRLRDKEQLSNSPDANTCKTQPEESSAKVAREVCLPFLSAGLGMVAAGLILDRVQHWLVFQRIPQFFIMVPALIGLKGNLEMTLASRLSTQANLGWLDTVGSVVKLGGANLALIQLQGVVVGALTAAIAVFMSLVSSQTKVEVLNIVVLTTSSVVTASLASFTLGIVMVLVIAVSRRLGINPDNVATPVAAALGDLITLALLSGVADVLYGVSFWPQLIILCLYVGVSSYCYRIARMHSATRPVLETGWSPVLAAMLISSLGGTILNRVIVLYPRIALFQPVINGVAGNLVGIQSSRISTQLHRESKLGQIPTELTDCRLVNPCYTFGKQTCSTLSSLRNNCVAARVLAMLVIPGHAIFSVAIAATQGFHLFSFMFVVLYLVAALVQVCFLLHCANIMVFGMWRKGINPDNAAIPYLTAMGDLSGGALLALVFHVINA